MKKRLTTLRGRIIRTARRAWKIAVHRPKALFLAGIILGSFLGHTISVLITESSYRLSNGSVQLIGDINPALADKLKLDKNVGAYRFNAEAVTPEMTGESDPSKVAALLASQKQQTGGGGKDSQNLYSLDLPIDPSSGVKVYDINSKTSFKLIPEFEMNAGRSESGRVVYPLEEGGQAVYTVKANGIKEDIVLQKPRGDELSFKYKLELPKTLEARLDERGNLGIYGVDPAVTSAIAGALQNGASSTDTERLKDVQENGTKNHLTYLIPAPTIMQSGNQPQSHSAKAIYKLNGDQLTVATTGLEKLTYPISIDPTVVVTSTSDFATGNNEDNISFDTDAISRAQPTSGTVGTWTATTSFTTGRENHTSIAYNGFLYVIGGYSGSYLNDVQYAPINADGTVGTWTATTSFTTARRAHTSVAYNGFLYVIGGWGGTALNDVQYAPINADGTVGTWTATTSFTTARDGHASVAYNGFLYVIGGGASLSGAQYAPINADGTVGTWTATTSFTTGRYSHETVFYNNHLYILGGFGGSRRNDVQYSKIDTTPDPTFAMSSWSVTTILGAGTGSATARVEKRQLHTTLAHNGYLYLIGGQSNTTPTATVHYAPINANGTVGAWVVSTNPLPAARHSHKSVIVNEYMYVFGGTVGGAASNTVLYSQIGANGLNGAWTSTTPTGISSSGNAVASYNGYLYSTGGTGAVNTVHYALVGSNGAPGTWTSTTVLTAGLTGHMSVAHNGYLYALGGSKSGSTNSDVYYAPINTDGSIGTWNTTTSTNYLLQNKVASIYEGHIIINAANDVDNNGLVTYAKINADGTVGSWSDAPTTYTPARSNYGSVEYNGYLYTIGGIESGTVRGDVLYAPMTYERTGTSTTGTTAAWQGATATNLAVYGQASLIYNGYVYLVGGYGGATYRNDVRYAPINANGTIGAWTTSPNTMALARFNGAAVAYNGYLYVTGGQQAAGTFTNTTAYAPLNADGSLGTWTTSANTFTTARYGHTTVAYNGKLYVVGGGDAANVALGDVKYATINANGSIGTWSDTTATVAARDTDGFVYGGRMYILGGLNGSTYSNMVRYANINANGTLSSWTTSPYQFANARSRHAVVALNGHVYLSGGGNASPFGDLQYAPIRADGSVGAWKSSNSLSAVSGAPAGYYYHGMVAHNGRLYSLAGIEGTGTAQSASYATSTNAPQLSGSYSKSINLGQASTLDSIVANGSFPLDQNNILFRVAGSNGVYGSWQAPSVLSGAPISDVKYVMYKVVMNDSGSSSMFETAGRTTVTDITVNYTLPAVLLTPENRLRHNKYFDGSEVLQPLQTQ